MSELEGNTREVAAAGLRQLATQNRGAFFSSTSLRTIATLLEAPCAEEVAAAKLALYSTVMGEIADDVELISISPDGGSVIVQIERGTYDTLMKNRTEPTT